MAEWVSGSGIPGIPVNDGRDLMLFNAIGGSYLVPNPNYGLPSAPSSPSFSPYVLSAPAPTYAPPIVTTARVPGPGGALGFSFSSFATPTPLATDFPIQADPNDAILTVSGFPTSPAAAIAQANGGGTRVATSQGVVTAARPFPWIWVAIGTLAVIVLSDDRRRN